MLQIFNLLWCDWDSPHKTVYYYFIIVSGDGDFLSLAKKLGEYGKKVIGCSYKSTANSLFTKVCDEFVFIDKTLEKEQLIAIEKINIDET